MSDQAKDLVVIGSGPGGYVGAIRASQLGLDVALVEKDARLGGTCLLRGCIPTKALLHSADLVEEIRHAGDHGVVVPDVQVDFPRVMARKKKIVAKSAAGVNYLMKKNKIEVVKGVGRLESPTRVAVTGEDGTTTTLDAKNVMIATGSVPRLLPGIDPDGERIVTSDHILDLTEVPESLIVLGAGAVGVEFASIYGRFGSSVTVVELLPRMLPIEDEEISAEFEKAFRRREIECHVETRMESASVGESGVEITVEKKGERSTMSAAMLLIAVGRAPYLEGLALAGAGVNVDEGGFVPVNPHMQTNVPGVYAIGDVVATPQLAHVASAEAIVAAEHMAGVKTRPLNYLTTPSCTYSNPEVASVGLSEAAAREAGYDVAVGKFPFSASGKARILEATEGFVKIVSEKRYDQVLGVHMIGPRVTELIAEAGLMLQIESTTEEIARLMHPHPTLSETVLEAAHGVHGSPIHI